MTHPRLHQLCWPSLVQRLLLRSLFLPLPEARLAYNKYRAQLDFDQMDGGCLQLMPLLAQRLPQLDAADPILARLQGSLRYHWCKNQLAIQSARSILSLLTQAGIPALALKGLALQRLYPTAGLRPMNDVDLLVPPELWKAAEKLLYRAGWHSEKPHPPQKPSTPHGRSFRNQGRELDLHAYSLIEDVREHADREFFERTQLHSHPFPLLQAPCDELLLFHVLVHGARFALNQSVLWVPDSLLLARQSHLDWEFFLQHVQARRLEVPVAETLSYLEQDLGLIVPQTVTLALQLPPDDLRWLEYARWAVPHTRVSSALRAATRLCQKKRAQEATTAPSPRTALSRITVTPPASSLGTLHG